MLLPCALLHALLLSSLGLLIILPLSPLLLLLVLGLLLFLLGFLLLFVLVLLLLLLCVLLCVLLLVLGLPLLFVERAVAAVSGLAVVAERAAVRAWLARACSVAVRDDPAFPRAAPVVRKQEQRFREAEKGRRCW
jgi:hypothetical protein